MLKKLGGSTHIFAFQGSVEKVEEPTTQGSHLCMATFGWSQDTVDPLACAHALLCTKIHTWWVSFSCLTAVVI